MRSKINRRQFLELTAAAGALSVAVQTLPAFGADQEKRKLISPGCRRSKVKVARIYVGNPTGLWPKPNLDFKKEISFYEAEFAKLKDELSDVDWVVDELVTSPDSIGRLESPLKGADGILVIHLSLGVGAVLDEIFKLNYPTMIFAVPYSGHEWAGFGSLRKQPLGAKVECLLTSDCTQLAAAVRPFRAIHHLKEAKILNLATESFNEYAEAIKKKFGTQIQRLELQPTLDAYNAVSEADAQQEADRWIKQAVAVVEPSRQDIIKSCRLALAFERLLEQHDATVMTVACYGSMYEPLCRKYAFPCIGFTRLNDLGLGGICESDLPCAVTHILFQGLTGRPGFVSDPTVDESDNSIILAHCLGTTRMDGPDKSAEPYKLRTIMERQEGAVPQVKMRIGQKVTQAILVGTDYLPYFTGQIVDVPDIDRGCRTKIKVRVDGDVTKLWQNWSAGLHRQTCYTDITRELQHFCRFEEIKLVNEAV
jgi:hypothetical protein